MDASEASSRNAPVTPRANVHWPISPEYLKRHHQEYIANDPHKTPVFLSVFRESRLTLHSFSRLPIRIHLSVQNREKYKYLILDMPTPPFSQDRRDWLEEVFGLLRSRDQKNKNKDTIKRSKETDSIFSISTESSSNSESNGAAKQNKAMGHGTGRLR
jgi:hypothetical protein